MINVPVGSVVELESPGEEILVIDRGGLDQALVTSADKAGATVLTNCPVDTVRRERDRVAMRTLDGTSFHARASVLACGGTYRFHGVLGLRPPAVVLHTAQVEVDAQRADALIGSSTWGEMSRRRDSPGSYRCAEGSVRE